MGDGGQEEEETEGVSRVPSTPVLDAAGGRAGARMGEGVWLWLEGVAVVCGSSVSCDLRPGSRASGSRCGCSAKARPERKSKTKARTKDHTQPSDSDKIPEARAMGRRQSSIDTTPPCSIPHAYVSYPITEHPQTLHGGISVLGREQSLNADGGLENLCSRLVYPATSRHYRDIYIA